MKLISTVKKENIKKYNTSENTFDDFLIETIVKVIVPIEDFKSFNFEEGEVIENSKKYLGIKVLLENGKTHNFNPQSLLVLNKDNEFYNFSKWFDENEKRFYQSQMDERDIAYSAYLYGKKIKNKNI